MAEPDMIKYPRTPHLEGSRIQIGDEDLPRVPFSHLAGQDLVVEEKCDGANTAVSFDEAGGLLLQSRGHYLTGGGRERHYDLFKNWAGIHQAALRDVLGSRYIMYGEWMYAKHAVYYDALPHYFLEFDILNRETGQFLDTPSRRALLSGLPVVSVPVLARGRYQSLGELTALLGASRYIREGHLARLRAYCEAAGEDGEQRCAETDPDTQMEGLYLKVERGGAVVERFKFVRSSFLQCHAVSSSPWLARPIIPNQLRYCVERIFDPQLPEEAGTAAQ